MKNSGAFIGPFMVALLLILFCTPSPAQDEGQSHADPRPSASGLYMAVRMAAKHGPVDLIFLDQATLKLPAGYAFIPKKEAADIMSAAGNPQEDSLIGLILPEKGHWSLDIDYYKTGYIKDDEAKSWDADTLLKAITDRTSEENKTRATLKVPEIEVGGWIQKPTYNTKTHQLVWSMLGKIKGGGGPDSVNYNTFALGRDGFFKVRLIAPTAFMDEGRRGADEIMAQFHYNPGKTYADFAEGSDRVAEYGIAALVTGIVAKKIGLLALLWIVLAKAAKAAIVAVLVFFKKIKKYFTDRDKSVS